MDLTGAEEISTLRFDCWNRSPYGGRSRGPGCTPRLTRFSCTDTYKTVPGRGNIATSVLELICSQNPTRVAVEAQQLKYYGSRFAHGLNKRIIFD